MWNVKCYLCLSLRNLWTSSWNVSSWPWIAFMFTDRNISSCKSCFMSCSCKSSIDNHDFGTTYFLTKVLWKLADTFTYLIRIIISFFLEKTQKQSCLRNGSLAFQIPMACSTWHWVDDDKSLKKVCPGVNIAWPPNFLYAGTIVAALLKAESLRRFTCAEK